jgi:hypothetical protein
MAKISQQQVNTVLDRVYQPLHANRAALGQRACIAHNAVIVLVLSRCIFK